MIEQMHTPEPWRVGTNGFSSIGIFANDSDDVPLVSTCSNSTPKGMERARNGQSEANARRIVACVNACVGMSTEMIERGATGWLATAPTYAEAIEQRDQAWQELREIREAIKANPEESTLDEACRVVAQRDELLRALKEQVSWSGYRGGENDDLLPAEKQPLEIQRAMTTIAKCEANQS